MTTIILQNYIIRLKMNWDTTFEFASYQLNRGVKDLNVYY